MNEKKKVIKTLTIGIIAGLIVTAIVAIVKWPRPIYNVQITPVNQGQHVTIDSKTLRQQIPNQDGILFIQVTGTTKEYDGKLAVELQPKDVPDRFKQDDATFRDGAFVARAQLGSRE